MTSPLPALLQAAKQQTQANRYLFLRRVSADNIVKRVVNASQPK